MGRTAIALWCLFIGFSVAAKSKPKPLLSSEEWGQMGNDFLFENQRFDKEWVERQNWDSWLCNSFYSYKVSLSVGVRDVQIDLGENGAIITANVENIYARANGSYRSQATLCVPTGGWLGAAIPWGKLKSEVHFGDSGDLKDIRLKILSTEIDRIQMGRYVPVWFEDFFTGVVNRSLSVVWNSKLGSWLSEKITQVVRKKIAERSR